MTRVEHVECLKEMKKYTKIIEKREGKGHLKDPGADGRIKLNWTLKRKGGRMWTGVI
jgi:hypothetical protein